MGLSEADTRAKLIDPALRTCGWTEDLIRREETAGAVEIVDMRPRRQRRGRVDYTLRVKVTATSQPVAVALLEAKTEHLPPTHGLEQGKAYAACRRLNVPFVFASNGQLATARALAPAYLRRTFGDRSSQRRPCTRLGGIGEIVSGVTLGRKLGVRDTRRTAYLRVANVKDGHLDLSDVYEIDATEAEIVKLCLRGATCCSRKAATQTSWAAGHAGGGNSPSAFTRTTFSAFDSIQNAFCRSSCRPRWVRPMERRTS